MCLILEKDEPLLSNRSVTVIHFHRNDNGTGINFIGLLHIFQLPVFFQFAHRHQRQIHQTDKFIRSARKYFFSRFEIILVCFPNRFLIIAIPEVNLRKLRRKSRMPAMVRPVSIEHANLRHRRVSVLLPVKVISNMEKVLISHRQTEGII